MERPGEILKDMIGKNITLKNGPRLAWTVQGKLHTSPEVAKRYGQEFATDLLDYCNAD